MSKHRRWHNNRNKIIEAAAEAHRHYTLTRFERLMRRLRRWWRSP